MDLIRIPANASSELAISFLKDNGYVIIDSLSSTEELDHISCDLDAHIRATEFGESEITGELTRRTGSLIARSTAARKIIENEKVLEITSGFLTCPLNFQLSLAEVISVYPGAREQFLHRDGASHALTDDYEAQVSTLWALTDFTEEMGATRIVPGSHRLPYGLKFSSNETVPAVMSKGSVLIYSGKLYHGAGANRSRSVRQAMNINYLTGWLRQEENQYLSCPPSIAKDLPTSLLKLMGYNTYMSFGRVGD